MLRLALQRTDRPKRDCAISLHADFVHAPETMEDMVKKLESGADLVVAERDREMGQAPLPGDVSFAEPGEAGGGSSMRTSAGLRPVRLPHGCAV